MSESAAPLLLMTPGPTRVPARVLAAGARPMLHHRTPEFSRELAFALDRLRELLGTRGDVLPVHATGRGAMVAALCNLFSPGDELVCVCNGQFGELWASYARAHGLRPLRVCEEWERSADPAEVEDALRRHPGARAVTLALCDTSSGVSNDVAAIAAIARERGALTLLDAVSSAGGMPLPMDAWGVDAVVTASQKCLMSAPGLAFVALGERARAAAVRAALPRSYWDFAAIRESLARPWPETPGTTPVHLVLQVAEALRLMFEEGLAQVYERHRALAAAVAERLGALGLERAYPKLQAHAPTLSALRAPDVDPARIRAGLRARGILVAEGLGPARDSVFRIGHLGDIRLADVHHTLDALAEVLAELRRAPARGAAARSDG